MYPACFIAESAPPSVVAQGEVTAFDILSFQGVVVIGILSAQGFVSTIGAFSVSKSYNLQTDRFFIVNIAKKL